MAAKAGKSKKGTQRKLTAILSADVAGYSRLMGADEESTIETLTAYRKVFVSHIESHSGRVVDAKGDAILAEFASVVDAVNGAVEIQRELAEQNAGLSDDRRMEFRIGVNLGDVVVKDDVIYGDGINIAARLESLAERGGICISRSAYDQVKSKLKLDYEYLGEQQVKNITEPVRAYRVNLTNPDGDKQGDPAETIPVQPLGPEGVSLYPPDKPSIAVLAFTNMSGDPEQEYFGDGLAEDIITDLSKLSGLFVIARNSSFSYKGRSVTVQQVGREMGVRYVLEGSVRKAGDRVRITAQLVDAGSANHLWAERFDRTLADVFAVQDEITEEVVTALKVNLMAGEQVRIWQKSLHGPTARDHYYQGKDQLNKGNLATTAEARKLFRRVVELEPESPLGYTWEAFCLFWELFRGLSSDPAENLRAALELVEQALERDRDYAEAIALKGCFLIWKRDYDGALKSMERAVASSPNGADVAMLASLISILSCRMDEAVMHGERMLRLSPQPRPIYLNLLAAAYRETERYEESIELLRRCIALEPEYLPSRAGLMCSLCAAERYDEARSMAKETARIDPSYSVENYVAGLPFRDQAVNDRLLGWLRAGGVI